MPLKRNVATCRVVPHVGLVRPHDEAGVLSWKGRNSSAHSWQRPTPTRQHPSFIRSLSVPRLMETQMNQARKSKIEALRKEAKEDFMRILRRRWSCTAAPIT